VEEHNTQITFKWRKKWQFHRRAWQRRSPCLGQLHLHWQILSGYKDMSTGKWALSGRAVRERCPVRFMENRTSHAFGFLWKWMTGGIYGSFQRAKVSLGVLLQRDGNGCVLNGQILYAKHK